MRACPFGTCGQTRGTSHSRGPGVFDRGEIDVKGRQKATVCRGNVASSSTFRRSNTPGLLPRVQTTYTMCCLTDKPHPKSSRKEEGKRRREAEDQPSEKRDVPARSATPKYSLVSSPAPPPPSLPKRSRPGQASRGTRRLLRVGWTRCPVVSGAPPPRRVVRSLLLLAGRSTTCPPGELMQERGRRVGTDLFDEVVSRVGADVSTLR